MQGFNLPPNSRVGVTYIHQNDLTIVHFNTQYIIAYTIYPPRLRLPNTACLAVNPVDFTFPDVSFTSKVTFTMQGQGVVLL